jgi:hypothetical protein
LLLNNSDFVVGVSYRLPKWEVWLYFQIILKQIIYEFNS